MIEFRNTIVIKRPLEEVFSFISNFENMPKWNYFVINVINVDKLTKESVGVGTTYHQTRKTDQQKFRVVEFQPNEAVAIETLPPEKELKMRFKFKPLEDGTQLIDEWKLETNTPGPFKWIAEKKVKSAVSENLKKLKALLETGHVILQDGREATYKL